jgi:hypothetical protein
VAYSSLAIGAGELPLVSCLDNANGDLQVAHCADLACASPSTTAFDTANNAGYYTSSTIGADGLGLVSYRDASAGSLKVAHCDNAACTSATLSTVDSSGLDGEFSAITLGVERACTARTSSASRTCATADPPSEDGATIAVHLRDGGENGFSAQAIATAPGPLCIGGR